MVEVSEYRKTKADLTLKDYYNVYGISLLSPRVDDDATRVYLCDMLNKIAEKYLSITLYALRTELRYARYGGAKSEYGSGKDILNDAVIRKTGLSPLRISSVNERSKASFEDALYIFRKGEWDINYGGDLWEI